jgi:uncharacterized membrane protein
MAFCNKCGAQVEDNAVFCPTCGAQNPTAAPAPGPQDAPPPNAGPQGYQQQGPQPGYQAPPQGAPQGGYQQQGPQQGYQQQGQQQAYQAPPPPVYASLEQDAAANKVYGVLAYFGPLVLISILAAPKTSQYSRYHSNQGLVFLISNVALGIAVVILTIILAFIPIIGWILGILLPLALAAYSITFLIFGILAATRGQLKPLPVIGKWTILK